MRLHCVDILYGKLTILKKPNVISIHLVKMEKRELRKPQLMSHCILHLRQCFLCRKAFVQRVLLMREKTLQLTAE